MATSQKIAERMFTYQDQKNFASLTGDYNPIHMDVVAARRSIVGDVVVHGMHMVLCALEAVCRAAPQDGRLLRLDAQFPKPVFLDENVEFFVSALKDGSQRLTLQVGEKKTAKIRLWWRNIPKTGSDVTPVTLTAKVPLSDPTDTDMAAQCGITPYTADTDSFAEKFPAAAKCIGAGVLRDIAATSTLVGMQCPGLRSLYSRLKLEWTEAGSAGELEYKVTDVDERYGLLTIAVQGHGIHGQIEAFHLPRPPRQMTIQEVSEKVQPDSFSGQTALIVGGSRGLGELTAKIVAAGGGHAIITYASGQNDADTVVSEIRACDGKADAMHYDVTRPAADQLTALDALPTPTHLYYYATCRIAHPNGEAFSLKQLEMFNRFYVHGFWNICQALSQRSVTGLSCFYPSTVFVEERPAGLDEYAMSKAAGEILAADLGHLLPGYHTINLRLPRLMTDQNASVTPQDLPQAIDILLPVFMEMQNSRPD